MEILNNIILQAANSKLLSAYRRKMDEDVVSCA